MSQKQDGTAPRTAADLERKYNFGRSFAEIMGVALDARKTAESIETKALAELSLKLGRDENDQIVTMLNASAEVVNITSNRLKITSDNFTLSEDGTITATNATISGNITATSGKIGGCEIVNGVLKIPYANFTGGLAIGDLPDGVVTSENVTTITEGIIKTTSVLAENLKVKAAKIDGKLIADQINADGISATGVSISGNITATSGEIGGCSIVDGVLQISSTGNGVTNINGLIGDNTLTIYDGDIGMTHTYNLVIEGEDVVTTVNSSYCAPGFKAEKGDFTFYCGYTLMENYMMVGGKPTMKYMRPSYIVFNGDNGYMYGTWYLGSSTPVQSDRNRKHNVSPLSEKYSALFDNLTPSTYQYNDGTSGRTHTGFIAQDVKSALEVAGISTQDFAGYVETDVPNIITGERERVCCLRYEEFIALNTAEIQKLKARVAELENVMKVG